MTHYLLKSFILAVCLFQCGAAFGQLQVYNVPPNATDSQIDQALEVHYAAINRGVAPKNRLMVFFPGTGGTPRGYKTFTELAADKGFHALGLRYVNAEAVNDLCGGANSDLNCYEKVRLETIDGTERTPLVNVNRPNSIENRLIKLLKYMHVNNPNDGWLQFLDASDNILWEKLVVAGHSQGGGHAGILGKKHRVARVIMFAAADYNVSSNAPANWITAPGVTPNVDFYGFSHRRDEQVNYNLLANRIWTAYGMPSFGAPVSVDNILTPYNNTHSLNSDWATIPENSNYHGAIIVDNRFPVVGGEPLYKPVWEYLLNTSNQTNFDYDGDGKADLSVFRPSVGGWYVSQSSNNAFFGATFGQTGDAIAPADFDGDGKTDVSVYRSGSWYRLNSSNGSFSAVSFGSAGDLPVPADFDGDGKADIAVFRPATGEWFRLNSSDGAFVGVTFGITEDKPVIGDFDGDGKADIAVFRPSAGSWYCLNSSNGAFTAFNFGLSTDLPVPADFDGDGKTDISVFRPSSGNWYRLNSLTGAFTGVTFGNSTDQPVAADFDGDNKADIGVFRPSDGTWYLLKSTGGFSAQTFGANGDIATQNAFVR